jgi:plasminogen activator inhibitor 1 RNA-binding protein
MTLDEWKAAQKSARVKPSFNLRKAGEGEDPKQWKDLYVLNKKQKKPESNEDSSDGEDDEEEGEKEHQPAPSKRKGVSDLIQIVFSDPVRRGGGERGFGGRGGGRGGGGRDRDGGGFDGGRGRGGGGRGRGGGGPRGGRGGGRGRGGGGYGEREQVTYQRAPKVDDERDFPSL